MAWQGEPPVWDEEHADALLGAYVIVGVIYLKADKSFDGQEQMHGRISVIDAERGICVELAGKRAGEVYWLPPALPAFHPAKPGEYRLRSTGEVIIDPDYATTWTLTRPPNT